MKKKENRNLQVAYRIELLPNNNQKEWEYVMQLDSVTWFDPLNVRYSIIYSVVYFEYMNIFSITCLIP
jgi:hypothetical protein